MLISYSKQFIFIHIYRVAGTSIRQALNNYQYPPHESYYYHILKRLRLLHSDKSLPGHITAHSLQEKLPRRYFNNFFKFAFVRNPWDWQVSLYCYARQNPDHFQHHLIKDMSFEEYIDWRVEEDKHLQKDFISGNNDQILVDFIGRFENLHEDFNTICRKIGVQTKLPRANSSRHKPYYEYYNPRTKDLVYQHFIEDVHYFNYTFQ